jgi:Uma2 family endonuclease
VTVVCGAVETSPKDPQTITNPTVIVEVLSPGTEKYDLGEKALYYRQIPSVQHLLFVSQTAHHVEHQLRDGDRWIITPIIGLEATIDLSVIGLTLALSEIYDDIPLDDDA